MGGRVRRYCGAILFSCLVFVAAAHARTGSVTQLGAIDALLAGAYDGQWPCSVLAEHGDLGIGTFHRLDGEMVVMEGVVYQVKADGRVTRPSVEVTTPFATVAPFGADVDVLLPQGCAYDEMKTLLDQRVGNENVFWALRVDGLFRSMRVRSVPAQCKPYRPLAELVREQSVFELVNAQGTLVGFRCPPYVRGVNVPGYHLHFLSADRKSGGHVLDFRLERGRAGIGLYRSFQMLLPGEESGYHALDLDRDRGEELKRVEHD
jgi:acetolactate decarboxylase